MSPRPFTGVVEALPAEPKAADNAQLEFAKELRAMKMGGPLYFDRKQANEILELLALAAEHAARADRYEAALQEIDAACPSPAFLKEILGKVTGGQYATQAALSVMGEIARKALAEWEG